MPRVTALLVAASLLPSVAAAAAAPGGELCAPAVWPRAVDPALCGAARRLAAALAGAPDAARGDAAVAAQARFLARSEGVVDAQVRPTVLSGPHLGRLLERLHARAGAAGDAAVLGVGLAPEGPGWVAALLTARRLAFVRGLSRTAPLGEAAVFEVCPIPRATRPVAWLGRPDGTVAELPLSPAGSCLTGRWVPNHPGRWTVQVVVEAGEGPEVAVLAPVWAGRPPPDAPPPLPHLAGDPVAAVTARVAALRRAAGLPPLAPSPELGTAAQAAAADLLRRGRVAHRPVTGGSAEERLSDAGVGWAWTGETLAQGPDAASALEAILESPAHRRVLLDPRARRLGVGLGGGPEATWLALVLTEPLGDRAAAPGANARRIVERRLLRRAETAIAEARAAQGLPAPLRDPALDDLADAHARRLAQAGVTREAAAEEATRTGAFAADPAARAARVETVVAGRPEAARRLPGTTGGGCDRLGLGLARGASGAGGRLWLTAVCVVREGGR